MALGTLDHARYERFISSSTPGPDPKTWYAHPHAAALVSGYWITQPSFSNFDRSFNSWLSGCLSQCICLLWPFRLQTRDQSAGHLGPHPAKPSQASRHGHGVSIVDDAPAAIGFLGCTQGHKQPKWTQPCELVGGPSNVLDLETERYIPYTIHAPFQ